MKEVPPQFSSRQPEMAETLEHRGRPAKPVGKSINLFYECAATAWMHIPDMAQTRTALCVMQKRAGLEWAEIDLHLVDDATISALNWEFLGCTGPTNIITFPPDAEMPGCMFLSIDCLARECIIYGQQIETHFLRLLAHGFGHLAGFEHGAEMRAVEEACFDDGLKLLNGRLSE